MRRAMVDPETLHRATAAIALGIGALAAASPRTLIRLYGIDPGEMTGAGAFGWRLFAARNLVVGVGVLRGVGAARDAALAVQAVDQLVFAHASVTRSIPRPTALAAMATSGAIVLAGVAARRLPAGGADAAGPAPVRR